jgi:acetyl-CoA C-acetyltransferase
MDKFMNTGKNAITARAVYVIDGARTPFLKAGSKPGPFSPVDLAVWAGRSLLLRQNFAPYNIEEVILGCVNPRQDEVNPGRVAALRLGCGTKTPGWTVQRNCGSGMQSVDTAFRYIGAGQADLILAGGTEALSHAPLIFPEAMVAWLGKLNRANSPTKKIALLGELRPNFFKPIIGLLEGLTDPNCGLNMGQTAEVLAHQFDISREHADAYALRSHQRLAKAQNEDRLDDEVVPIYDDDGTLYDRDNGVRPDANAEQMAKLSPVFEKPFGDVTAGNSSQITDGACWLLLASEQAVEKHGLEPIGKIIDCHWVALHPKVMGLGPAFAIPQLLQRNEVNKNSVDIWEINEAFAAQVLACLSAWRNENFCREYLDLDQAFGDIPDQKLNVDGGAISLGHPVGTSGARIILHALNSLKQNDGKQAIASECIGGGQAGAMLLEAA